MGFHFSRLIFDEDLYFATVLVPPQVLKEKKSIDIVNLVI